MENITTATNTLRSGIECKQLHKLHSTLQLLKQSQIHGAQI